MNKDQLKLKTEAVIKYKLNLIVTEWLAVAYQLWMHGSIKNMSLVTSSFFNLSKFSEFNYYIQILTQLKKDRAINSFLCFPDK